MFHTYVTAFHGGRVDMDRAQFLMDKELVRDAIDLVESNRPAEDDRGEDDRTLDEEQAIWTAYSRAHREKYGADFRPDADATWDA